MLFQSFKKLLLALSICICFNNVVIAQDFYKDYQAWLTPQQGTHPVKRRKLIDAEIARMKSTIDGYEKENNRSFFATDTVFIVDFLGAENGDISEIIWTTKASCYYDYNRILDEKQPKITKRELVIKTNASEILDSFDIELRKEIEFGDTLGYQKYADKHKVFDGEWISPIRAIKEDGHWKFIAFKGNGWAIDYTNAFKKKNTPANINAIINNLSKEHFGFDIDSANTAYLSDTSKFKKHPSYPVILLNGKVISYDRHEPIELYRIKAISIWQKNSHDPAIPNGVNSEFGIIVVTTNEKSN